ncbi:MAG TPA: hypothetical protein VKI19_06000 [Acidimicrobiales bacterium]|nr:hypothetical protein [Acidimicrobiales bacterium]
MTTGGLRAKVAAVALVLSAGGLVCTGPAGAIQTTTWGIKPAPHGGQERGSLSYPSNGQTVHDSIVVYNRTGQAEAVNLQVLGATQIGTTFQYSVQRTGLAAGVSLAGYQVTLPPHEQATVPVTVKLPRHSKVTTLAAIAAEGPPVPHGSALIEERLVILVKATPSTRPAPLVPNLDVWGPVAGAVLALAAGLVLVEARRRRSGPRADPAPAERAGGDLLVGTR